jgi:hypothetical protein
VHPREVVILKAGVELVGSWFEARARTSLLGLGVLAISHHKVVRGGTAAGERYRKDCHSNGTEEFAAALICGPLAFKR